jgi:Peptidase A4 family
MFARNRTLTILAAAVAICVALATSAAATQLPNQVSTNWAGYAAVTGRSTRAFARRFTNVTGSWVQPAATCESGQPTFSAFWVGLGGYRQSSRSLEQVGTEADCSAAGVVSYYAWYEYVPAGPHTIHVVPIAPGDTVTASVSVKGHRATVSLTDTATGATFTHVRRMLSPRPDVGAAEWIAEAPSNCNRNNCTPLTLTNFGTIAFTGATATAVGLDGVHTGVIDDPDWTFGAINLQSGSGGFRFAHDLRSSAAVGALAATGNSFSVTYTGGAPSLGAQPGNTGGFGASGATGGSGTTGSSGASGTTGAT